MDKLKALWARYEGYRTKAAAWLLGVAGGLITLNDMLAAAGVGFESLIPEGAKWRSTALIAYALLFYWLRTQTAKEKAAA